MTNNISNAIIWALVKMLLVRWQQQLHDHLPFSYGENSLPNSHGENYSFQFMLQMMQHNMVETLYIIFIPVSNDASHIMWWKLLSLICKERMEILYLFISCFKFKSCMWPPLLKSVCTCIKLEGGTAGDIACITQLSYNEMWQIIIFFS